MACKDSFKSLRNGTVENGCDCPDDSGAFSVEYEPLTAEWFRQNAGLITLIITLILLLKN